MQYNILIMKNSWKQIHHRYLVKDIHLLVSDPCLYYGGQYISIGARFEKNTTDLPQKTDKPYQMWFSFIKRNILNIHYE